MGKIILTETQYKRFRSILIENTINQTLLNEIGDGYEPNYDKSTSTNATTVNNNTNTPKNSGDLSYTVQSTEVNFETGAGRHNELRIFKGAKFVPNFKGKLYANTKFQFVDSDSGEVQKAYDESGGDAWDSENKLYTFKGNVYYNCSTFKFTAPDKSTFEYYAEESAAVGLQKQLVNLCKRAADQGKAKTSYGAESVGGGKSYAQQNDYVLTSDSGKTIKIPKGTGYAYKEGKQGASFKLPGNKFGWFACPYKTFLVDNVKYKDPKGYLAGNIVKSICEVAPKEKEQETLQTRQYRSSGTNQVVGQGGGGSSEYSEYI